MRVHFQVGQVWRYPKGYPNTKFTITKIVDGRVLAYRTDQAKESGFASCDRDGYGDVDRGWEVTFPISDWRAWRHDRPGDCVCGIPKERCDYHR